MRPETRWGTQGLVPGRIKKKMMANEMKTRVTASHGQQKPFPLGQWAQLTGGAQDPSREEINKQTPNFLWIVSGVLPPLPPTMLQTQWGSSGGFYRERKNSGSER